MLTIRNEQLNVFRAPHIERLVEWLSTHVPKDFPHVALSLSPSQITALLQRWIDRGITYKLDQGNALAQFVVLGLSLGPRFPDAPEHTTFRAVLEDTSRPAQERLDHIIDQLDDDTLALAQRTEWTP